MFCTPTPPGQSSVLSSECGHRAKEGKGRGKQLLRSLTAKQGFGPAHSTAETKTEVRSPLRRGLVSTAGSRLRCWKDTARE